MGKTNLSASLRATAAAIGADLFNMACAALAVWLLWGWFIEPLGVPRIGYFHAFGVALFLTMAVYRMSWSEYDGIDGRGEAEQAVKAVLTGLVYLWSTFVGWIVYLLAF